MKQLGYAALFLMFVMIIVPSLLVKSCSIQEDMKPGEKVSEEVIHTIKVYIQQEDNVVEMNFNEYLKGVVAAEMPASFHIEALKAQAIAARTYVYHRMSIRQKTNAEIPGHKGADICTDSSHCKAWISKKNAMEKWGILSAKEYWNKISQAVDDTANIIITYENEPIDAVFHSTSSGKTENSEDVWANNVPYLRSTWSEGEQYSPKYETKVEISKEEFINKIQNAGSGISTGADLEKAIGEVKRTEGGSVDTIVIGNKSFEGTEVRKIFGLNSANFTIELKEDSVIFKVTGNGHGVGMSQYGANYLAQQGKTYEAILKKYYRGVRLVRVEK